MAKWVYSCVFPDGRTFTFNDEHAAKAKRDAYNRLAPRGAPQAKVQVLPNYGRWH